MFAIKILTPMFLVARLALRSLDIDWALSLRLWQSRPAIEVILEDPDSRRDGLVQRLNVMYPF